MLGAPCCPLKSITSAVKDSCPGGFSPNRAKKPRELAWVSLSLKWYGGLTPATGESFSQLEDRSMRRAFLIVRKRSPTPSEASANAEVKGASARTAAHAIVTKTMAPPPPRKGFRHTPQSAP